MFQHKNARFKMNRNCSLLLALVLIASCAPNKELNTSPSSRLEKSYDPHILVYRGKCLQFLYRGIDATSNCGDKMSKTVESNGEHLFLATSSDESILKVFNSPFEVQEWEYQINKYTSDVETWNPVTGKCLERRILERGTRMLTCNLHNSRGEEISYIFEGIVIKKTKN